MKMAFLQQQTNSPTHAPENKILTIAMTLMDFGGAQQEVVHCPD